MAITRLQVVNECLKVMAEPPINSLENEDHPYIAAALSSLDLARIREQADGWWFNIEYRDLVADSVTGQILIPNDCLNVDPLDTTSGLVQRGNKFYDTQNSTNVFPQGTTIRVRLVVDIPFDELPIPAQMFVMYSAVLDFCKAFDADGQRVQEVAGMWSTTRTTLKALDIKNRDTNFLQSGSAAIKLAQIAYPSTRNFAGRNRYAR